jgi:hypothetical protein
VDVHLISWNLNKQPDLLKAALDHAATLPCVILAIQEVPHMGKRPKKLTSLPLGELTTIYALRDQQMVQHHTNQPKNAGNFPLYNPAWAMLAESRTNGQPAGTYRYKELQYSHWLTLDYCLLSSGLMGRFREISVLSKIGNIELMKQGGDTIRIGDHLPVQALLNP